MEVVFPGSQLHKEANYLLTISYKDVFSTINAPQNQNRFTEKEKSSVDHISKNFEIGTFQEFNCEYWKKVGADNKPHVNFKFHAEPTSVLDISADTLNFKNAHEFKHASLVYNHFINGSFNIFSLRKGAEYFYNDMKDAAESEPVSRFLTKPLAYVGKLAYAAFSRQEERICDKFALRAFPETDLEEIRQDLTENNVSLRRRKPPPTSEAKPNIFKLAIQNLQSITDRVMTHHPDGESRYAALTKTQQRNKKP